MVEPIAAVVAAEEPEIAAKNIPETATTWASPPESEPTMDWEKFTSLLVTPPADMNAPASMKKGTARNEKESMPVYMTWAIMTWGMSMKKKMITDTDRQSDMATGTPRRVRRRNEPMSRIFMSALLRPFRRTSAT